MNDNKFLKDIFKALGGEEKLGDFGKFKTDMSDRKVAENVYEKLTDTFTYGESALDTNEVSFDDFYKSVSVNDWYGSSTKEAKEQFLSDFDIDPQYSQMFDYFDFENNEFDMDAVRSNAPDQMLDFLKVDRDNEDLSEMYLQAFDLNTQSWDASAVRDFATELDFIEQQARITPIPMEQSKMGGRAAFTQEEWLRKHKLDALSDMSTEQRLAALELDAMKRTIVEADDLEQAYGLSNLLNQGQDMSQKANMETEEILSKFRATEEYKKKEEELRGQLGKLVGSYTEDIETGGGSKRVDVVYTEEMVQRDLNEFAVKETRSYVENMNKALAQDFLSGKDLSDDALTKLSDYYFNNFGLDLALDDNHRYNENNPIGDMFTAMNIGWNTFLFDPLETLVSDDRQKTRVRNYLEMEMMRADMTAYSKNMTQSLGSGNIYDFMTQAANMLAESSPIIIAGMTPGAGGLVALGALSVGSGVSDFNSKKTIDEERIARGEEPIYDNDREIMMSAVLTAGGEFTMGGMGRVISGASKFAGIGVKQVDDLLLAGQRAGTKAATARAAAQEMGSFSTKSGRRLWYDYVVARGKQLGINMNTEGFEEIFAEATASIGDLYLTDGEFNADEFFADILESYVGGSTLGVAFDAGGSINSRSHANAASRVDMVTGASETLALLNDVNTRMETAAGPELAKLNQQKLALEKRREAEVDERAKWYRALEFNNPEAYKNLVQLNANAVHQTQIANDPNRTEADRATAAAKAKDLTEKAVAIQQENADITTDLTPDQKQVVSMDAIRARQNKALKEVDLAAEAMDIAMENGDMDAYTRAQQEYETQVDKADKLKQAGAKIQALTTVFEKAAESGNPEAEAIWNDLLDARLEAAEALGVKTDVVQGKFATSDYNEAVSTVRGSRGLRDEGAWSAEAQVKNHFEDSDNVGSTFNLNGKNVGGQPLGSVSIFNERSEIIKGELTPEALQEFADKNKDILDGNGDILSIGTWLDTSTGETYLDIVATVDKESAAELGREYNQKAIFDLETFTEIETGGTGEVVEGLKPEAERVQDIRKIVGKGKEKVGDKEFKSKRDEGLKRSDLEASDLFLMEEMEKSRGQRMTVAEFREEQRRAQDRKLTTESPVERFDPKSQTITGGIKGQYVDIAAGGDAAFTAEQLPDLSREELEFLNTVVKAIGSDKSVRVHLTKASSDVIGSDVSGYAVGNQGIHIMPQTVLDNMRKESDITKTKTFQEVVLEEVGHMITTPAIKAMSAAERSALATGMQDGVAGFDAILERGLAKVDSYAKFFGINTSEMGSIADLQGLIDASDLSDAQKEQASSELHDEYIQEVGAAVAMDPKARARVKIKKFVQSLFKAIGLDINVTDASAIKVLDGFVKLRKGDGSGLTELRAEADAMVNHKNGRASKGISPARLPDSPFRVFWWQANASRFGGYGDSNIRDRYFNDKWDFVRWWNYTTLKGTSTEKIWSKFEILNEDGTTTPIDVDQMKKWKMRKPVSRQEREEARYERAKIRAERRTAAKAAIRKLRMLSDNRPFHGYDEELALKMLNIPAPPSDPYIRRESDIYKGLETKDYEALIAMADHAYAVATGDVRKSALLDSAADVKAGRYTDAQLDGLREAAYRYGLNVDDIKGMTEEEFTEVKNEQLCGIGNPGGCKVSSRVSNQEFKRHLAADNFGISLINENTPAEQLDALVAQHAEFYATDLQMAYDFVKQTSGVDPLNFYEDTRAAAGKFVNHIKSELAKTGAASAKAVEDIDGLEDLFVVIMGITSNQNTAEPNMELACKIFYEAVLNYNINNPARFVSPAVIRALSDSKSDRHAEFDQFVSPSNPLGVKGMGAMLRNLNGIIAKNLTEDGKIDVKAITDSFMEIDPNTGRQAIERMIGTDAPKIGTFITNMLDPVRSGQFATQDLHVGDYMSASVGSEVTPYADRVMVATQSVKTGSGSLTESVLNRAKILKKDDPKTRVIKLAQFKNNPNISKRDRVVANRIWENIFKAEIGRDKGANTKRKNLRDRILRATAAELNRTGAFGREVTPAMLGQVMYAYNQLRENPMAKRLAPRSYTPYAPYIDAIIEEGSFRDLSKVDRRRFADRSIQHIETLMQPPQFDNQITETQEADLARKSQLLLPFNAENVDAATNSPLYRSRNFEEVDNLTINGKPFSLANDIAIQQSLMSDPASARVMAKGITPQAGQKVGIRLNLNVKRSTGIPVQTVHDKSASGEALTYAPAVVVKNANLFVNQAARKNIATFQENKFPMASVDGDLVSTNINDVIDQYGFDGVKAVFNPVVSPYFTDVSGRPIKSASEATVIGSSVFLRGEIEYMTDSDPEIQRALRESDSERAKRVKRGPKYDNAVKRFEAYMRNQGVTFNSREQLERAYNDMPLRSAMALTKSEVAERLVREETLARASKVITPKTKRKMRQFNRRASAKFEGARADIMSNPEAYISRQKLNEAKEKLEVMDNADLVSIMTDESLGRLSMRNDDMSVLAGIELINRAVAQGEFDQISSIVNELGKIGTTAGRILRHFGELNTSTPQGLAAVINSAVEKAGNSLTEKQKERLDTITKEYLRYSAEAKQLMKKAANGEDVEAELEGAINRLKIWEKQLETFTNATIERGWGEIAKMLIQGNLLTSMSQATNVVANMFNAFMILPRDLLALPAEKALNLIGIESHMKDRKLSLAAYMYGIRKFGSGFMESLSEIATGQTRDVSEWRIHRGFAPFRSFMTAIGKGEDLPLGPEGSKMRELFGPQSASQRAKMFVQGTFGVPAETMFRFLSLGDTPFRRMIEGMELYNRGLERGLEGEALKKFIKYPPSDVREDAERRGRELTFQEETSASRTAESLVRLMENTLGSFVVRSQIPYVRTPVNIVVETLTYTSPIIGVSRIYKDLKNNDPRAASENLAKVMMGGMVKFAAAEMLKNGLLSGPVNFGDDEERNLTYAEFPPNSINVDGLKRLMNGEDPSRQADDYYISYQKLGIFGAILGSMAQTYNEQDIEEDAPVLSVLRDAFGVSALSTIAVMMEQSFLAGVNSFTELLSASGDTEDFERKLERWLDSTFRAISSVGLPNQLSVFSKMAREYMPDMRIDKEQPFEERLLQRFSYTVMDRTFNTDGIPVRINWKGEPIDQIPRGSAPMGGYYLFDVMKVRQGDGDPVSTEVWSIFEDTQEIADIIGTPYFADLRKMKAPYPRTKKEKKAFESAGLNFSYLDDEEFMAQTHRMTVVQANRVMEIAAKQRYIAAEELISSAEYQKEDKTGRLEMLNDLNTKFSGVKEMDGDEFRPHTIAIMEIMQEIYENERSED